MNRTLLRTAAVVASALLWTLPTAAWALERVPFTSDGGTIKVQGTVDGQPVPMLVDLGAGVNVLSQGVGSRTVDVTGKYVTLSLTGQRVDLPIGTVVSIALGEFRVDSRTVGIWKGLDGTGAGGLISATAFRNVVTTFDFRAHELLIEDAVTFADRKRFATRVPLFLQDELGIALSVFARFDFGNGQSGLCVIDTGMPGITIDRRFAAKLGVNLADPGLKHAQTPLGEGLTAAIPSLALADAPEARMERPNVVFEDLVSDCNVGNEFWNGKIFTLDIPERVMYLAPPS
ncbi:MAG TPA: aspartyl protease family protein [Candidatus Tumulicola sp.]